MKINVCKEAIWPNCHTDNNVERWFDFSKSYAIMHYTDNIHAMGIIDGFNLIYFEKYHIVMLKAFYDRTNKYKFFQKQLLWHNKWHIKALAIRDILALLHIHDHLNSMEDPIDEDSIEATNTWPTWDHFDLSLYGRIDQLDEGQCTWTSKLSQQYWCFADKLAKLIDIPKLILALAVFVKKQHWVAESQLSTLREKHCREQNWSWAKCCYISTYKSLICWVHDGHDPLNVDKLV